MNNYVTGARALKRKKEEMIKPLKIHDRICCWKKRKKFTLKIIKDEMKNDVFCASAQSHLHLI